jgi:GNAT superfamily N-acetyltransferase
MHLFSELSTEQEWKEAFPVLVQLRSGLTLEKFLLDRDRLLKSGYHLFGLKDDGRLVSVASAIVYPHVSHGSDCWVHDLATSEHDRDKGYGRALMQHMEKFASSSGCSRLLVHTRDSRDRAQNFYGNRMQYDRYAVVFQKAVK